MCGSTSIIICASGGDYTSVDAALASASVQHGDTLVVCDEACTIAGFTLTKWVHITVSDTVRITQTKIANAVNTYAITLAFTESCPESIENQEIFIEGFYWLGGYDRLAGDWIRWFDGGNLEDIDGKVTINRCISECMSYTIQSNWNAEVPVRNISSSGPDVEFRNCDIGASPMYINYYFKDCDLSKITLNKVGFSNPDVMDPTKTIWYYDNCSNSFAGDDAYGINVDIMGGPEGYTLLEGFARFESSSANLTPSRDNTRTMGNCYSKKLTCSSGTSEYWYVGLDDLAYPVLTQRKIGFWLYIPSDIALTSVYLNLRNCYTWGTYVYQSIVATADVDITDQWQWVESGLFSAVNPGVNSNKFRLYLEGADLTGVEVWVSMYAFHIPDYGAVHGALLAPRGSGVSAGYSRLSWGDSYVNLKIGPEGYQVSILEEQKSARSRSGLARTFSSNSVFRVQYNVMFADEDYRALHAWWSWARQGKPWDIAFDFYRASMAAIQSAVSPTDTEISVDSATGLCPDEWVLIYKNDDGESYVQHWDYWVDNILLNESFAPVLVNETWEWTIDFLFFVIDENEDYEAAQIDTVSGNTITLTTGAVYSHAA